MRETLHVVIADPDAALRTELVGIVGAVAAETGLDVAVHEASNGTSALAACSDHRPRLLITETLLEGLSGLALLRRLSSEASSRTAVILVTDMARETDRYWGLRNGAIAYLAKPVGDGACATAPSPTSRSRSTRRRCANE